MAEGKLGQGRRKALRGLHSTKGREKAGRYLVEGVKLVTEALEWEVPLAEVLVDAEGGDDIQALAARAAGVGIPVTRVDARDLRDVSDTVTPQGILAVGERELPPPLPTDGLVVLLDAVQDPGNVGTLLRAADAFNAEAVLVARGSADVTSPKVLRAAMGSAFHLPVIRTGPAHEAAAALASMGYSVLVATLDGEDPFELGTRPARSLLVLGNESRGPGGKVLRLADRRLTVPILGPTESLNVAMAGSILLSDLMRLPAEDG